jgi:hypothetical protein
MTDWPKVQAEMLRLEQHGAEQPDVLATIARIMGADIEGLHETLRSEIRRCEELWETHYANFIPLTVSASMSIAFMQGITLAVAFASTDDKALVRAAMAKLEQVGLPIVEMHAEPETRCSAVLIEGEHYSRLLDLVPPSTAMTEWIMQHDHIGEVE